MSFARAHSTSSSSSGASVSISSSQSHATGFSHRSVEIEASCSCGDTTRASGAVGLIACRSCGEVLGGVCEECGSVEVGRDPGACCGSCGAPYEDPGPLPTPSRRLRKARVHEAKNPPGPQTIRPEQVEGLCDPFTGAPLAVTDSLQQCRSCGVIARAETVREIERHFDSRCPACDATTGFRLLAVEQQRQPTPTFRDIPGPGEGAFLVTAVERDPRSRSLLLRLWHASGEAVPALITAGRLKSFGGAAALRRWQGKRVSCGGARAYCSHWGEVRILTSPQELQEISR